MDKFEEKIMHIIMIILAICAALVGPALVVLVWTVAYSVIK